MYSIVWTVGMKLNADEPFKIKATLAHFSSNKTKAATALGISIRTLDVKLKEIKEMEDAEFLRVEEAHKRREEFVQRSRGIPAVNQYDTSASPRSVLR